MMRRSNGFADGSRMLRRSSISIANKVENDAAPLGATQSTERVRHLDIAPDGVVGIFWAGCYKDVAPTEHNPGRSASGICK